MSPTTSAPAARPSLAIYLPLLGLTWALSVCVMGIGAALCAFYQNRFPSSEVGGVVRQLTFAGAWMTLWGIILTVGNMVAPTHFLSGLALNFGANFLGFLQLLVGSGSLHSALSNAGCAEKCTLFRSLEGVSFAACWILFFTLIPIAMAAVKRPSVERQHGKETEHF